jgi:hypothetical protein
MAETTSNEILYEIRKYRRDISVAIVVAAALALGWLLREYTLSRTKVFQDATTQFQIAYPAGWSSADSLQDVVLKVENPETASTFKTNLIVEARDLDPQDPPTLQTLIDRRVAQHGALTGYHFLSDEAATVDGQKAQRLDYAYVVQPLDTPRRASLPVVVRAREYIVVARDRVFYITLAAPDSEWDSSASGRMDQMIQSARVP